MRQSTRRPADCPGTTCSAGRTESDGDAMSRLSVAVGAFEPGHQVQRYNGWIEEPSMFTPTRLRMTLLGCLAAAVIVVYAYAACGPLRASTSTVADTSGYLGLTAWLLDGRPVDMHEVPSRCREFPAGYPLAIAALYQFGMATPTGLLALNFASLAVALAASWVLLRRALGVRCDAAISAILLTAAATICCELSVSIASEMLFFAASTVCLVCLERISIGWVVAGALACGASICVRAAGVALIPAVALSVARLPASRVLLGRKTLPLALTAIAGAAWLTAVRVLRSDYVSGILSTRYSPGADWGVIAGQQVAKLSAFGELFANLRAEDFRTIYRGEFVLVGVICLSLISVGAWTRRSTLGPLDVYLAAYASIILIYPFFNYGSERRFWLPVLPFLFGLAFLGSDVWARGVRLLAMLKAASRRSRE